MAKLPGEELPPVFSNRFYVHLSDLTRIVFSESIQGGSGDEYPRAAILMDRANAVELAHLILKLDAELTGKNRQTN